MPSELFYFIKFIIHLHYILTGAIRTFSITSWQSMDGDFDYEQFWRTIVDFFEWPPGREAWRRVDKLLEWWTRCIIYPPIQAFSELCFQESFQEEPLR
jgi:hypothetical protein